MRKPLSKMIRVKTSKLPRWKPKIIIDRRTIQRGDDEHEKQT